MTSRHHRGMVQDVPPHKFYTCNKLACFGEVTSLKPMVAEWNKIHKKKGKVETDPALLGRDCLIISIVRILAQQGFCRGYHALQARDR